MNIQLYIATVALAVATAAYAQPMAPPPGGPGPGRGPGMERKWEAGPHHGGMMGSNFFCPELVMRLSMAWASTLEKGSKITTSSPGSMTASTFRPSSSKSSTFSR
jgi:hypothetical protein